MKFGILAVIVGAALIASASVAIAEHTPDPFPSDTSTDCAAAGGAFSANPGVSRTCVVIEEGTAIVAGSHPNKPWTVEVATSEQVTYTTFRNPESRQSVHDTLEVGDDVLGCWNHNGNAIEDFENNPHCQPAAEE